MLMLVTAKAVAADEVDVSQLKRLIESQQTLLDSQQKQLDQQAKLLKSMIGDVKRLEERPAARAKIAEKQQVRAEVIVKSPKAEPLQTAQLAAASAKPGVDKALLDLSQGFHGSYMPPRGFQVAKTANSSLYISGILQDRYMNQMIDQDYYVDHLGNKRPIDSREDVQLQRILVFFNGQILDPAFTYQATLWALSSSGQVAFAGNMNYKFNDAFMLSAGLSANPGSGSNRNVFPYFLGTDRRMADEFFRPSFTSGVYATGEPIKNVHYKAMIGNSLSQLGVNARQDSQDLTYGLSSWWEPTTGEFGPLGSYGDYESHQKLATRFGFSSISSREDRFNQPTIADPENTQLRLGDGTLLFATGSLAPGVTVKHATENLLAFDGGMKYQGFSLHGEYYARWFQGMTANGPLPLNSVFNQGFVLQASYMAIPKTLQIYTAYSTILGDFAGSYEVAAGLNYFPFDTRAFRLNAELIHVDQSPTGSIGNLYKVGQTGNTLTLGAELFW